VYTTAKSEIKGADRQKKMVDSAQETIILGTCNSGPFRHMQSNLINKDVKWISCGYRVLQVDWGVLDAIKRRTLSSGTPVLFALWDMHKDKTARPIRFGKVDYVANYGDYVIFTVFLDDLAGDVGDISVGNNPQLLCRYGGRLLEPENRKAGMLSTG
jgi:hypothetical protein